MSYICDMGEIEIGRCGFCNDVKPVNRFYMYPSLYKKPENTKGLYNDGDYFIITYWCNDCGKPGIERDYNEGRDGERFKNYLKNSPGYIRYQGYPNDLRQQMHSDYIKRENAYFSPRTGVEYLSQCFLNGKKLHKINSGISWVQRMEIGRCIDSNGWDCSLKFVLDDIKKYPTKWRVYKENSAEKDDKAEDANAKDKSMYDGYKMYMNSERLQIEKALHLDRQPLTTEVEKEMFLPEENSDKLGKGGTGFKLALSHAWFPKPKLSFLKRFLNAIKTKINFNDKKS